MRIQKWLVSLAAVSCIVSLGLASLSSDVEAQRGRRRRGRGAATDGSSAPAEAPNSAEIARVMEGLGISWGIGARPLFEHFRDELNDSWGPRLAKAGGAIEEDRLRHQLDAEIRRIRSTYVAFDGEGTGWDTSFLRDEYTHGNHEAMMEVREEETHSRSYYFLINDHLWKRYQAFDSAAFGGATFEQFAEAIQRQFGPGIERSGSLVEGRPPTRWIEWQDETTRLRAIDETRFYGFFCLVFEERATLARLPELRTHTIERDRSGHSIVDSVILGEGEDGGGGDAHADVTDRITGRIRRRSDAPEGGTGSTGGSGGSGSGSTGGSGSGSTGSGGSGSGGSGSGSTGRSSGTADPDDPFAGMDL